MKTGLHNKIKCNVLFENIGRDSVVFPKQRNDKQSKQSFVRRNQTANKQQAGRTTILFVTLLIFGLCISANVFAKKYYWVGGTGNWSDLSHWGISSGAGSGQTHGNAPTVFDTVIFDNNSFSNPAARTVTLNQDGMCHDMLWQGTTDLKPIFTINSGFSLSIAGSLLLQPGMTFNASATTSTIYFGDPASNENENYSITTNGVYLGNGNANIVFRGNSGGAGNWITTDDFIQPNPVAVSGGKWTAADTVILTFTPTTFASTLTSALTFNSGTIVMSGINVFLGAFDSQGSGVRNLDISNSTITLDKQFRINTAVPYLYRTWRYLGTNNSLNDDGSNIILNYPDGINYIEVLPTDQYNKITFAYNGQISSTMTADTVIVGSTKNSLYLSNDITVNKYFEMVDCDGMKNLLIPVTTPITPVRNLTIGAGGVVKMDHVVITDVKGAGNGVPHGVANCIFSPSSSGWYNTNANNPVNTVYWVGGAGNWNDRSHWANSSGGNGGTAGCIPSLYTTVIFDDKSELDGETVTINTNAYCRDMTWHNMGALGIKPTLSIILNSSLNIYGSLEWQEGMTVQLQNDINYAPNITMNSVNGDALTVTSHNVEILGGYTGIYGGNCSMKFQGTGQWTITDDFNVEKVVFFNSGKLVMSGINVSLGAFDSYDNGSNRDLDISNSTITLNNRYCTGNVHSLFYYSTWRYIGTNHSLNDDGSNIILNYPDGINYIEVLPTDQYNKITFAYNGEIVSAMTADTVIVIKENSKTTLSLANNLTVNKYFEMLDCGEMKNLTSNSSTVIRNLTIGNGGAVNMDRVIITNVKGTGNYGVANCLFSPSSGWENINPVDTVYWVGGAGDWNDGSHWANESGGNGGTACIISLRTTVIFDEKSGFDGLSNRTVTVSTNAYCRDMIWHNMGALDKPTLSITGNNTLNIYGSLEWQEGMTVQLENNINYGPNITMNSGDNDVLTVTSHNVEIRGGYTGVYAGYCSMKFQGTGQWTITDTFKVEKVVFFNSGTLVMSGIKVYLGAFYSYDNGSKRDLDIRNSTIKLNNRYCTVNWREFLEHRTWGYIGTATNHFLNASGSHIELTYPDGINYIEVFPTHQYNKITFDYNGEIKSAMTADTVIVKHEKASLNLISNLTVNKYFDMRDCHNMKTLSGSNSQLIKGTGGVINMDHVVITGVTGAGEGVPHAVTNCVYNSSGWEKSSSVDTAYWVQGAGNWDEISHWASLSGGEGGTGCIPSVSTTVIFDQNSGLDGTDPRTVTINTHAYCRDMIWHNMNGPGKPTLSIIENNTLNIYGSLEWQEGMTVQLQDNNNSKPYITMNSGDSDEFTITSNNVKILGGFIGIIIINVRDFTVGFCSMKFQGTGRWTMTDDFEVEKTVIFNSGTLVMSGINVSLGAFESLDNGNHRHLDISNSTITLNNRYYFHRFQNTLYTRTWGYIGTAINHSLNADGSHIKLDYPGDINYIEVFPTHQYNKITFDYNGQIYSAMTADTVIVEGIMKTTLYLNNNLTVNKYFEMRACDKMKTLTSSSSDVRKLTIEAGGVVDMDHVVITDVKGDDDDPYAVANCIFSPSSSGWVNNSSVDTVYWVGGAGDWNDRSHWASSSGGPGGVCIPSLRTDVIFDQNSGLDSDSQPNITVTVIDIPAYCRNMTWRNMNKTFKPNFSVVTSVVTPSKHNNTLNIYGSLEWQEGMTVTLAGVGANTNTVGSFIKMSSDDNEEFTIKSNNVVIKGNAHAPSHPSVTFQGTGKWTITDDFNVQYNVLFYSGTLVMSGINVSLGAFNSEGNDSRTLDISNSKITLSKNTGNGSGQRAWKYIGTNNNTTLIANGSNIYMAYAPYPNNTSVNYFDVISAHTYDTLTYVKQGTIIDGTVVNTLILAPGFDGANNTFNFPGGGEVTINRAFHTGGTPCNLTNIGSSTTAKANINVPVSAYNIEPGVGFNLSFAKIQNLHVVEGADKAKIRKTRLAFEGISGSNTGGWILDQWVGLDGLSLGKDTSMWCNATFPIYTDMFYGDINTTYLWNDNSTLNHLVIDQFGDYWVEVNYDGSNCKVSDTIHISQDNDIQLSGVASYTASGVKISLSTSGLSSFDPSPDYVLDSVQPAGAVTGLPLSQSSPDFYFTTPVTAYFSHTDGLSECKATCEVITPMIAISDTVVTDDHSTVTVALRHNDFDCVLESCKPVLTELSTTVTAQHGTVELSNDTLRYTPSGDYTGIDSLHYILSNSINCGGTSTAAVYIITLADTFYACQGTTIAMTQPAIDGISYVWYDAGNSQVSIANTYSVVKGSGEDTGEWHIAAVWRGYSFPMFTVRLLENPVANASHITGVTGNTLILSGTSTTLTVNASPEVADPVFEWYDAAVNGNLFHTGHTYTTSLLTADTTFYISVAGSNLCAGAYRREVTVQIAPAIANDDVFSTLVNTPVTCDVLANDNFLAPCTDPQINILTSTPANGTLTVVNGKIVYTPAAGFYGVDVITYSFSCGAVESTTASLKVIVSKPLSQRYIACPEAEVWIGFKDIPGVTYEWYETVSGPYIKTADSIQVTKDNNNTTQSWWVKPVYSGESPDYIEVELEAAAVNAGGIVYVNKNNFPSGDGSTWETAYHSLAEALIVAQTMPCIGIKEIWVAEGTYYPEYKAGNGTTDRDKAFVMVEGVKIYGGFNGTLTGSPTVVPQFGAAGRTGKSILSGDIDNDGLDAGNTYHVVIAAGDGTTYPYITDAACLDGFTVTGGYSYDLSGSQTIQVNGVAVERGCGAGVAIYNSAPTIANDTITGNRGSGHFSGYGGGIYVTSTTNDIIKIINTVISNNTASNGGGVAVIDAYLTMTYSSVENNTATGASNATGGGILYRSNSKKLILTNVTIKGNKAEAKVTVNGGGLYCNCTTGSNCSSSAELTNVAVTGNLMKETLNSTITGGIESWISMKLINVTIAGNNVINNTSTHYGGAGVTGNMIDFRNCIIWGNMRNGIMDNVYVYVFGTVTYNHTLLEDAIPVGTNNITGNPEFIAPELASSAPTAGGNYRLKLGSPAIDAGYNLSNTELYDLDGNVRIQGCAIDLGAYETEAPTEFDYIIPSADSIVFVNLQKSGDGSSWEDAYPDLAEALMAAKYKRCIKEIWVAEGTYYPEYPADYFDATTPSTDPRDHAFVMVKGVKLYGGFPADATTTANSLLSSRDWTAYPTILSGDIGTEDDATDNTYHVVIAAGEMITGSGTTADTARLDGFIVTDGNADYIDNNETVSCHSGGGMYITGASPIIANDSINGNNAIRYGGGVYIYEGSPEFINTSVNENTAACSGGVRIIGTSYPVFTNAIISGNKAEVVGGISIASGSPVLTNTLISGNTATVVCGGISIESAAEFVNVTIAGNYSNNAGTISPILEANQELVDLINDNAAYIPYLNGGLVNFSDDTKLYNTIVWGNINGATPAGSTTIITIPSAANVKNTLIQGEDLTGVDGNSFDGTDASNDPLFINLVPATFSTPTTGGDYHLQITPVVSPAIDAGDDSKNNEPYDLDGAARKQGTIDLGVYETESPCIIKTNGAGRVYVRKGVNGKGSSWTDAYPDLADVLKVANTGGEDLCNGPITEIWVAVEAGETKTTYYPKYVAGTGITDRDKAFVMVAGVKIYGGFKGDEDAINEREADTVNTHGLKIVQMKYKTILSGDLGNNNVLGNFSSYRNDDVYHVVIAAGEMTANSITACLDGFTVKGGNTNDSKNITVNGKTISKNNGGGVYVVDASPVFAHDSIVDNNADERGGGMYIMGTSSSPVMTNMIFNKNNVSYSNQSSLGGGGLYISNGSPDISLTMICSNTAANGGGLYLSSGSATINRTVINGNTSNVGCYGGGVYVNNSGGTHKFTNTLISGNVSYRNEDPVGSGVYNAAATTFINVTVAGNYSAGTNSCGLYNSSSSAKFYNTLVWGNKSASNTNIGIGTSPADANWSNSYIEGVMTPKEIMTPGGEYKVFVDLIPATDVHYPQLGGDYRLCQRSPAIDMGDDSKQPVGDDLAGNARKKGCAIDIGAYESEHTPALNPEPVNGRVYVTETGAGSKNGRSWDNAYPGLAYPLKMAANPSCYTIKEIWVAEGTYYPRYYAGNGQTDKDRAFVMVPGVKVYGGFKGIVDEDEITDRETVTVNAHGLEIVQMKNKTILSGDFDNNDVSGNFTTNRGENVYHVVIAAGEMTANSITACLDGFTVKGGNANNSVNITVNGKTITQNYGGGVYVVDASPVFAHDSIADNIANQRGGGMYITGTSSSVMTNMIFNQNNVNCLSMTNIYEGGGGLYIYNGTSNPDLKPAISRTMISSNTVKFTSSPYAHGGGLRIYNGSPVINHTVINGNTAVYGGGVYIDSGSPVFTNTLVSGNRAAGNSSNGSGGGIYNNETSTFINVTVAGNRSDGSSGIYGGVYNGKSGAKFYNTLVWGNTPISTSLNVSVSVANWSNNFMEGMAPSNSDDYPGDYPVFVNPIDPTLAPHTGGDYRLCQRSPAIDMGDSTRLNVSLRTLDLSGDKRVKGCNIDIGAYESDYTPALNPEPVNGRVYVTEKGAGNKDGSSWDNAYPGLAYPLKMAAANPSCYTINEIWVAKGTYYPRYYAGNGQIDRDRAFVMVSDVKLYGGFEGNETAINERDTIVNEHGVWQMVNKTILSGDFEKNNVPGTFTSYRSNDAYHTVIAAGVTNVCLDGFTVKGGNADNSGNIIVNGKTITKNYGGGVVVFDASPVFAHDSIADNIAQRGGGMYIDGTSSPVMTNMIFNKNNVSGTGTNDGGGGLYINSGSATINRTVINGNTVSHFGGGVYANTSASPKFTNTLISGNVANGGGGVYNLGTSTFTNVTIAGNYSAGAYSGVYNDKPGAQFYNTIVWGNTPVGTSIGTIPSTGNVLNSLIQDITLPTASPYNNLNGINPLFVSPEPAASGAPKTGGDYRLRLNSPVIDKGNYTLNTTPLDLAGETRMQGCEIDLGAYETEGVKPAALTGRVYIKKDGTGDGSSWEDAYPNLAVALALAKTNTGLCKIKEIWVAEGTYYPEYAADYFDATTPSTDPRDRAFVMVAGVKIYGGFRAAANDNDDNDLSARNWKVNQTILSGDIGTEDYAGDNAYHVVIAAGEMIADADTARLDGFTVTGGNAESLSSISVNGVGISSAYGGGGITVINASPVIINDSIASNKTSNNGGGIHIYGSNPVVTHTVISNNTASFSGGGVAIEESSNPVFSYTVIKNNISETAFGGGVSIIGSSLAKFTNTVISGNTAPNGGGVAVRYNDASNMPEFTNTKIIGNTAIGDGNNGNGRGGGMLFMNGFAKVTNTLISGNTADYYGGGVYVDEGDPEFINATIAGNFSANSGGLYNDGSNIPGTVKLYNTIIYGNTNGTTIGTHTAGNSLVEGVATLSGGTGNFNGTTTNPLFVSTVPATSGSPTTGGDYHLDPSSPVVDAGDDSKNSEAYDLDGADRKQGCAIDLGAYEMVTTLPTVPTPSAANICSGDHPVIHLESSVSGVTYNVYDDATAGTLVGSALGDGSEIDIILNTPPPVTTTYYVEAEFGPCRSSSRTPVDVTVNPKPSLTGSNINTTPATCNQGGTITVTGVTGGTSPYEYKLDGGNFQLGNSFSSVSVGIHSVTVKDANGCETTLTGIVINESTTPPNYPDLRIRVCADAGHDINLSKYIDTLDLPAGAVLWASSSGVPIDPTTGVIPVDRLGSSHVYTFTYTVSNACVSDIKRKVYLEKLNPGRMRPLKDTVVICAEHAEAVQINQLFGIDARGTWSYMSQTAGDVDAYVKQSSTHYPGALIMNGKAIFLDSAIPNCNCHSSNAKKVVFTYTSANDSCLKGKSYTIVIILN